MPKFEAKSRLETRCTDVRRVSNADFNEEIGQTLVALAGDAYGLTNFLLKRVSPIEFKNPAALHNMLINNS